MNRSLGELNLRAGVLSRVDEALRDQCISIARNKSPSASYNLALIAANNCGIRGIEAIGVAKANRWLSVIRRDHGDIVFNKAVARFKGGSDV